jgi:hypothetical protein
MFHHLKCEMAEFTANSPEDIPSEIRWTFEDIPQKTASAVCIEWVTRSEWTAGPQAEFYHTD